MLQPVRTSPRNGLAIALVLCLFLVTSEVKGQVDTGAILGNVTDTSGAVVPGTKVTITNEGTSHSTTALTGSGGAFSFTPVRIGTYTVSAEYQGFERFVHPHVTVNIQQQVVVNITLVPGKINQTVQVTSAVPLLQTQDASVGQIVGAQDVNNLPLEGRNYTFLAQLVAGVTKVQQNGRGLQSTGTFDANGTQYISNSYLLDGIDNNSTESDFLAGQTYVAIPPIDAIQEFKVQTGNYSAEFGRAAGAVINASLKSGTNEIHGDVWEFVRNSGMDAADYFEDAGNLQKGAFRQNQFGFTLGGPLGIPSASHGAHKSFFFLDYEGLRVVQAQAMTSTVPTAIQQDSGFTNFSDLITGQTGTLTDGLGRKFPVGTIFDPATTRPITQGQVDPVTLLTATTTGYARDPFPNNMIPATRLDPVGVKLAEVYPLPTNGNLFNNYISHPLRLDDYNEGDARIDHNFSDKDTMFGRFSNRYEPSYLPTPLPGIADGVGNFYQGDQYADSTGIALSETHSFSPTTVNELRAGYSRLSTLRTGPLGNVLGIPQQYGFPGVPQFAGNGGLPQFHIGDLTSLGTHGFLPADEVNPNWQINENLTKIHGNHTLKVGMQFMHVKAYTLEPAAAKGNFDYDGLYTSIPGVGDGSTGIAQFVLEPIAATVPGGINYNGGTDSAYASGTTGFDDRQSYMGFYGQDDWKVRSNLTLNLGLRWDYYQSPLERYGAQANFVPGPAGNGAEYLIPNQRCSGEMSSSILSLLQSSGIAYRCSGNPSLATSPYRDFAPRFGIAYRLSSKLVVRGGYGIFFNAIESIGGSPNLGSNYPFQFKVTATATDPAHPVVYPNGSIGSLEVGLTGFTTTPLVVSGAGVITLEGFQYHPSTPYTQDWNITLQEQITPNQSLQIGYVGNGSRHLFTSPGSNEPSEILPTSVNYLNYIPFPDFVEGGSYVGTEGNSNYDSLQATLERRFNAGLYLLANYTYSKCLTDAKDLLISDIGGYRAPYLPNFGIQGDYGLCDTDVPNMVHVSGGYALPIGQGEYLLKNAHGVGNALLGGWKTNWILALQDGQPFTVGCVSGTVSAMGCNAFLVPGENIYAGSHNASEWLNPAAFVNPPAASAIGQSSYAPLGGAPTQAHSFGFHRLDFSLFKNIRTTERSRLEFRAEIFNLTNHPNFALPGNLNFLATPKSFGIATSTIDGPYDSREIQLALKFYW